MSESKRPIGREQFDALLCALGAAFAREGREGGDQAAAALLRSRTKPYRRTQSESDPGDLLDAACALPGALPLAGLVQSCRPLLDWTAWEGTGLAANVSSSLHTTELVGPDGHITAEDVRVGLLVSNSNTDYPLSSHSGEETYLIIAGLADWVVGDTPYTPQPPGAFVHHPAWVPHGRRTHQDPFLGAWRWSGDLDLSTFSVEK